MLFPERFNDITEGEPGAIVDEFLSESGSLLYYAYFNKEGDLEWYADFEREASPEDIAKTLNLCADEILCCPPVDVSPEKIYEAIESLRKQAQNVPGLRQS